MIYIIVIAYIIEMKVIKNLFLILVSTFFSLLIVEIILRTFTDFPKFPDSSLMAQDSNFGFKMNNYLTDIDSRGFRNIEGRYGNYQIAIIGDSHTYGYGVTKEDTWPYQFEKSVNLPVYNYGNSGNGIYSYHYLAKDALAKNKKIILGLYLPNDFTYKDYVCLINFNNSFWKKEVDRLKLNPPQRCDDLKNISTEGDFIRLVIMKFAVISITYELIWKPFKKIQKKDKKYIKFHKNFEPLEIELLEGFMRLTDLNNPKISLVFSDFKKIIKDLDQSSDKGSIGVIIIPSPIIVYLNVLDKLDIKPNDKPSFLFYSQNEILLEKKVLNFLEEQKIPALSVNKYLLEEYIKNLSLERREKFYIDGSHPNGAGHRAYAETAKEIYLKMKQISN